MKNLYIRFGEIPEDMKSKVFYNGEFIVKEQEGVSVYNCVKLDEWHYQVIIPNPITYSTLDTYDSFCRNCDKKVYLVSGDCVGIGTDNEPLIKNINIIRELPKSYFHITDKEAVTLEEAEDCDYNHKVKVNGKWRMCSKTYYDLYDGEKEIVM